MDSYKYKIFVINLDRATLRWEKMRVQLERLGLPFERFSAVDGNAQSGEFLSRYYCAESNKKDYYAPLSKSEIACYISHLKACEKIVAENLDYAIILEDDVALKDSFKLVPWALASIKNWSYIKLIAPFKKKKIVSSSPVVFEIPEGCEAGAKSVSPTFELVRWKKPPAGTQAYAITKAGAKEFFSKRSRFSRPIDMDLQFTWETNLEIEGLVPSSCALSDDASQIAHKEKPHYPFAHFVYKLKYAKLRRLFSK